MLPNPRNRKIHLMVLRCWYPQLRHYSDYKSEKHLIFNVFVTWYEGVDRNTHKSDNDDCVRNREWPYM